MYYNSNKNSDVFTSSTAYGQLCCGYFSFCIDHHLNEAPTLIAPSLFSGCCRRGWARLNKGFRHQEVRNFKSQAHSSALIGECSMKMLSNSCSLLIKVWSTCLPELESHLCSLMAPPFQDPAPGTHPRSRYLHSFITNIWPRNARFLFSALPKSVHLLTLGKGHRHQVTG